MISVFESAEIGGVLGKTATMMIPIPGAGIVLSPIGAAVGERIGLIAPKISMRNLPDKFKDSIRIYRSGDENNTSFRISDQINVRKEYLKKAKELGYNNIGQSIAAIDPGTLSIVPNVFIKK